MNYSFVELEILSGIRITSYIVYAGSKTDTDLKCCIEKEAKLKEIRKKLKLKKPKKRTGKKRQKKAKLKEIRKKLKLKRQKKEMAKKKIEKVLKKRDKTRPKII